MKKMSVLIILCMLMLTCVAGCGSSAPTPTETAETFLSGIQEGDDKAINSVYAPGNFSIGDALNGMGDSAEAIDEDEEMFKSLMTKFPEFEYELSNEQIKEDKASVDVKITTYPFGSAMKEFLTDYMSKALELAFSDTSEEEMTKLATSLFTEKIDALTEKSYTKTATLTMTQQDGVWKIDEVKTDSDIADALTGGLMSALNDMDDLFSDDGE